MGLGASPRRLEDYRFVTGDGLYASDLSLPGQAYLHVVRSPHAHARLLSIDVTAARKMQGVLAVLTGADAAADGLGPIPCQFFPEDLHRNAPPSRRPQRHVLARDRVRHVGEAVAVVVADSPERAGDAAEAVLVDYDVLPPILGLDGEAEVPLWPEAPDGVCFRYELGDETATRAAFARAAHRVALTLANNRVAAHPLEQRSALGAYDRREGRYVLQTSTQAPHRIRGQLARSVFGIDESRVAVRVADVGGAFGLKVALFPEEVLVLWAARRTGRPVRWLPERSESFLSDDHARDVLAEGELALDADGRILGMRVRWTANIGAYLASTGTVPSIFGPPMATGPYRITAAHVTVTGRFTNTQATSPYRGAGRPEATYIIERLLDQAAREIGIDRVELRRRNLLTSGDMPATTPLGHTYDCGDFPRLLASAAARADWAGFEARRAEARARGRLRGIGVAYYIEVAAFFNERMDLRLEPDGALTLTAGTLSTGQGHETVYAQLLSSWLGIPMERIRLVQGDTDRVGFGRGTFGSRSMTVGGEALKRASDHLVTLILEVASAELEASVEDLAFTPGRVTVEGTDRSITLPAIAARAYGHGKPVNGRIGLEASGASSSEPGNYPNGCNICELEVDPETGIVEISRFLALDDVGTVINPMLLEGQIHGGLAQGIGQAWMEGIIFDAEGQLLTGSFLDYQLPRASDLPAFEVETMSIPTGTNLLGVKGAGEAGCVSAPPAFMSALLDALAPSGVETLDMPATPARVWQALRAASEDGVSTANERAVTTNGTGRKT